MRPAFRVVVVGASLALAFGATSHAQKSSFGAEETVIAVEVPVQVLVDGKPVAGLKRENFEVLEGRKVRQIVDFEVVDLSLAEGKPAPAVDVPPSGRRHFLLLFDLTNSEPSAIERSRAAATRLVEETLHASDLAAVATWSYTGGPRLILGFTTDRQQLAVAIETLGVADIRNKAPDPLGIMLAETQRESVIGGGGGGRLGDTRGETGAVFLEELKSFAANERAAARNTKKDEIASFTEGTVTLARLMSGVLGRKYVVLLSQGFDSSVVTGTTDASSEAQASRNSEMGEIWNIDSVERFGDTHTANKLEGMLAAFRRADCVIHAVDIGGLAVAGTTASGTSRASGRETLLTMARDTGGQLYENFNDLGQAMGKMLASTSVTYVLTIQPSEIKLDGKFHDLKVKLVGGPSGARLVHRPGYYAPVPYKDRAGLQRQMETAQLLVAGETGGDLVAGVAAAAFRGEGDRAHVPVVIEVDGSLLLGLRGDKALPVSFYSYAFDEQGTVADFVAQSLALDLAQVGQRLAKEPLKFVGDLRLPAGNYSLRTLVRAGDGGAYWLGRTALEVPAFAAGSLAAVAPLVPAPMTKGVVIRSSSSAQRTQGLAFPFMMGAETYLPVGLPSVAPGGEVKACLNVYGLDTTDVKLIGELVDGSGRTVPDAQVTLLNRTASDQPGLQRLELAVKPGSAGEGDYSLRVTVEQTGRRASASSPLRVGA